MEETINQAGQTVGGSPQKLPGVLALLNRAFSVYKERLAVIAGIAAVPTLFGVLQIFVGMAIPIVFFFVVLLGTIFSFLSYLAFVSVMTTEGQSVGDAYRKSIQMALPALWVSILTAIAVMGGFILLIVPGVILSLLFCVSFYVLFVENRRGLSALISSWHYARGYLWAIAWRFLFLSIIMLLVTLVISFATNGPSFLTPSAQEGMSLPYRLLYLFFSNFIALPLSVIYTYGIYQVLKQSKVASLLEVDEKEIKRKIIIFSVLGLLAIAAVVVGVVVFALL